MRLARIEVSSTALRLLAVDARRNALRATVDDALRVVALGTEAETALERAGKCALTPSASPGE